LRLRRDPRNMVGRIMMAGRQISYWSSIVYWSGVGHRIADLLTGLATGFLLWDSPIGSRPVDEGF
jgi:uncharacterized protein (DUF433 family)